ncbi:MAG TPA: M23 family metallopeptidase [Moheibacter sp.]|nr:M23 family metallopeptidase [Moheibacter sp.]
MRQSHILLSFLFALIACSSPSEAQQSTTSTTYPKGAFRNPLGITNFLSGNFGELRNNHFHSGIDIKTNQKEGYNIYAVGDGFISRINVSPRGYGNALYIDHPNGYTTVYAHLQKFNSEIEEYVRAYQYKNETFSVEIYPEANELKVKESDIIAISGNSGSSGGPHLHFEIRDTQTEEPINPFLFGFDVPDTRNPLLNGLYLYAIPENHWEKTSRQTVANGAQISAAGKVGFGVKAYDQHNGAENQNGVYQINVFVNDDIYYTYTNDRLNFETTRAINCLVDYEDRMKNNSWVYQLYKKAGDPLQMYSNVKNDGILNLEEGKTYAIRIEVKDFAGNKREGNFKVIGKKPSTSISQTSDLPVFHWNQENYFKAENIEISLPKGVIYEDLSFDYRKTNNGKHAVHDWNIPVHNHFTLAITPENLPTAQLDKAILVREYQYRGAWKKEYIQAEYKNGKVVGNARNFGTFSVEIDQSKPNINPVNIKENTTFTGKNGLIKFTINDSQSGIAGFSAYIDGRWILTNYDQKTKSLTIDLNREKIDNGKHQLELKVWDEKNNTATYQANFNKN